MEPKACAGFAGVSRKFALNVLLSASQFEKEAGHHNT